MAEPTSSSSPASSRTLVLLFVVMLVAAGWILTRSWNASILDRYEFRQLQTALSSHWMKQDGFKLDYETPLFGPPWSIPMEFPTYQACVAGLSGLTGLPLEQCGRLVSMLFLFATLPALYGLLELARLAPSRRLLVLIVVLTSPVYLFYGRANMIETTALGLSTWFLFLLYRATASANWRWIVAATLMATLPALTKVTTFAAFCVPAALMVAALLWTRARTPAPQSRPVVLHVVGGALPFLVAAVLTTWWVRHGDAVKDSNPFSGFLTARELRQWNFGSLALRVDVSFWQHARDSVNSFVLCEGALAVAVLCAPFAGRRCLGVAAISLAGFFAGLLVFSNLYHLHDYYYCANAIFLTGAAGVLLAGAWDNPRWPAAARWLALTLIVGLQLLSFDRGYGTYHHRPNPPPPALAEVIRASVPAEGVVLIYGADWNPLLPYYAQRRTIMVPGEREDETAVLEQIIARLPPRQIAAIVTHGEKFRQRPDFIKERTARFGLAPQAFARSGEDDLYLPESVITRSANQPPVRSPAGVQMLAAPAEDAFAAALKIQDLTDFNLGIANPAPFEARTQYGFSAGEVDGQPILNAHAPSELRFHPPLGATHLSAKFGLAAGAYAPGQAAITDGITVEVFVVGPGAIRHTLFRRELNPARNAADRGTQSLQIDSPQPFTGILVFRIGPGAANNPTNDWAYWSEISIR